MHKQKSKYVRDYFTALKIPGSKKNKYKPTRVVWSDKISKEQYFLTEYKSILNIMKRLVFKKEENKKCTLALIVTLWVDVTGSIFQLQTAD